MGKQDCVAELRWLPELETNNRLQGDCIWLKLVYQFWNPYGSGKQAPVHLSVYGRRQRCR